MKRLFPVYVGLVMVTMLSGCSEAKPTLLQTQASTTRDSEQEKGVHSYSGKITGVEEVAVVSKISGRIENIHKEIGDPVNQGEVLISLEKTDLQAQLESAKSDVALARAKYEQITRGTRSEDIRAVEAAYQAALAKYQDAKNGARPEQVESLKAIETSAKTSFENAKSNLERTESLFKQGAVSKQAYETAQVTYKQAESQYVAAQENLKLAVQGPTKETLNMLQASVDQAKAGLDKARRGATPEELKQGEAAVQKATAMLELAKNTVDNGSIKSPISGFVASKEVHTGELAAPGKLLVTVVNTDQVYVSIQVADTDLTQFKVDQAVEVKVDALNKKVKGKVSQISPKAEEGTNKFLVKILVDNSDHSLRSGMIGIVKVE